MAAVTAAATPEPAIGAVATVPTAAVPVASSARDLPGNSGGGGEEGRIGIRRVTKYDFKSVVELFRVRMDTIEK